MTEPTPPRRRRRLVTSHDLRVSLLDVEPAVWRLVRVRSEATLGQLHGVLQAAMGWTNSHLHQFRRGEERWSDPRFGLHEDDPDVGDELDVRIADLLRDPGATIRYEYDLGDGWTHEVRTAAIGPRGARDPRAVCLDGRRACPPEDCGGSGGYEELLAALADPKHESHREMVEWLDGFRSELASFDPRFEGSFDPDRFDVGEANAMIQKLSSGERWEWACGDDMDV